MSVASESWCGATLIADQWIITAAHCLTDRMYQSPIEWTLVTVGSNIRGKGREVAGERVFVHPGYNRYNDNFDFALVKLMTKVSNKAICLPKATDCDLKSSYTSSIVDGCQNVTAAGWGSTKGKCFFFHASTFLYSKLIIEIALYFFYLYFLFTQMTPRVQLFSKEPK